MGIQLNHISGLTLALLAAAAVVAPVGSAQDAPPETIPTAVNGLLSTYSGDYYRNRGIARQANRIIGFSFPERELDWDADATAAAVRDIWRLQNTVDPTLRVPDLATPFSSSLQTLPTGQAPAIGSEFIFESF
jgi:hypothetical protein